MFEWATSAGITTSIRKCAPDSATETRAVLRWTGKDLRRSRSDAARPLTSPPPRRVPCSLNPFRRPPYRQRTRCPFPWRGKHLLIDGWHRLLKGVLIEWDTLPAYILTDAETWSVMLPEDY